jgi:hypothetical protein
MPFKRPQHNFDLVPFVSAMLVFAIVLVLLHRIALPELPEHLLQIMAVLILYRYFWLRIRSAN